MKCEMKLKDLYEALGELLESGQGVGEVDISACGAESVLRIFRDGPDGCVTGVSLEDASYMEAYIDQAREILELVGKELRPQHFAYLVEMCEQGVSDKELREFVLDYAEIGSENSRGSNDKKTSLDARIEAATVKTANNESARSKPTNEQISKLASRNSKPEIHENSLENEH